MSLLWDLEGSLDSFGAGLLVLCLHLALVLFNNFGAQSEQSFPKWRLEVQQLFKCQVQLPTSQVGQGANPAAQLSATLFGTNILKVENIDW